MKRLMTMIAAGCLAAQVVAEPPPKPTFEVGGTAYADFPSALIAATSTWQAVTVTLPPVASLPDFADGLRGAKIAEGMDGLELPYNVWVRGGDPGWMYMAMRDGTGDVYAVTAQPKAQMAPEDIVDGCLEVETAYENDPNFSISQISIGGLTDANMPTGVAGQAVHTFRVTGTGALELFGSNTYTARTEVAGGTLRVAGPITGSARIDVAYYAALDLQPGGSIGVPLTFNEGILTLNTPAAFTAPVTFSGEWQTFNFHSGAVAGATNGTAALTLAQTPLQPLPSGFDIELPHEGLVADRTYALIDGVGNVDIYGFAFNCPDRTLLYDFAVSNGVLYVTTTARGAKTWYIDPVNGLGYNDGLTPQTAVVGQSDVYDRLVEGDTVVLFSGEHDFGMMDGIRYVADGDVVLDVIQPCEERYDMFGSLVERLANWDLSRIERATGSSISFRVQCCGDVMVARNLPPGTTATTYPFVGYTINDGAPYIDAEGNLCVRTLAYYDEEVDAYKVFFVGWNGAPFWEAAITNLNMSNYAVTGASGQVHTPGLALDGSGTLTLVSPRNVPVDFLPWSHSTLSVSGGTVSLPRLDLTGGGLAISNGATVLLTGPLAMSDEYPSLSLGGGVTLALTRESFRDGNGNACPAVSLNDRWGRRPTLSLPTSGSVNILLNDSLPYGSTNVVMKPFASADLGKVAFQPTEMLRHGYSLEVVEGEDGEEQLVIVRTSDGDPYETWATANNVQGGKAAVTEGEVNLIRYAFDRPTGRFSPIESIEFDGQGNVVVTTLPCPNAIPRVRVSRDVADWSNAVTTDMVQLGLLTNRFFRLTYPVANEPKLFFRLVAE